MSRLKLLAASLAALLGLASCGFSPAAIPFPGGADLGSDPYAVTVNFNDVLDLVPQSAVRVNDIAVGKVTKVRLNGWRAAVTVKINKDVKLPGNAVASIGQTSLLGEKYVALSAPASGATGRLRDGDVIGLDRSGRNPEIEEVLGAASLLFNGGGLDKTRTVVRELNKTLSGNEPQIRELLTTANTFLSQLDRNKTKILTALDKVNHLAISANKQKAAIDGALDQLPEALTVVNQQRGDLVKLLRALERLGKVGTRVVATAKADMLADLKSLVPILTQLSNAGDDLARSLTALLTFPFPDGAVNGHSVQDAKDFQPGDYFNLSVGIDASLCQLAAALDVTNAAPGALLAAFSDDPECPAPLAKTPSAATASAVADIARLLTNRSVLLTSLVDGFGLSGASGPATPPLPTATTGPSAPSPGPAPAEPDSSSGGGLPRLCSLFGSCKVAP